jgi:hypothetical protein
MKKITGPIATLIAAGILFVSSLILTIMNPLGQKIINPPTHTPTTTLTPSPTSTPTPVDVSVYVYSAVRLIASTGITVHAGDTVEISVLSPNITWNCGRPTDVLPYGYTDEFYSDTLFKNAPVCALIGAISSTQPDENFDGYLLVGMNLKFIALTSGKLYLGCNDSFPRFDDNPTYSKLKVRIVVTH